MDTRAKINIPEGCFHGNYTCSNCDYWHGYSQDSDGYADCDKSFGKRKGDDWCPNHSHAD